MRLQATKAEHYQIPHLLLQGVEVAAERLRRRKQPRAISEEREDKRSNTNALDAAEQDRGRPKLNLTPNDRTRTRARSNSQPRSTVLDGDAVEADRLNPRAPLP